MAQLMPLPLCVCVCVCVRACVRACVLLVIVAVVAVVAVVMGVLMLPDVCVSQYAYNVDERGNRELLGSGRYGSVFAAYDHDKKRMIAVKEIRVINPEWVVDLLLQ